MMQHQLPASSDTENDATRYSPGDALSALLHQWETHTTERQSTEQQVDRHWELRLLPPLSAEQLSSFPDHSVARVHAWYDNQNAALKSAIPWLSQVRLV
jgi:hypothetical protein